MLIALVFVVILCMCIRCSLYVAKNFHKGVNLTYMQVNLFKLCPYFLVPQCVSSCLLCANFPSVGDRSPWTIFVIQNNSLNILPIFYSLEFNVFIRVYSVTKCPKIHFNAVFIMYTGAVIFLLWDWHM